MGNARASTRTASSAKRSAGPVGNGSRILRRLEGRKRFRPYADLHTDRLDGLNQVHHTRTSSVEL